MARRGKKKKPHKAEQMNYHHRFPKTHGGSGDITSRNMIRVPAKKHAAYHMLFGTKHPAAIARILTETWIDPEWELVVIARRKQ